ncbi:MAG TPA: hypothetical protein VGM88_12265 [Kofleriaceae bacterium]|jgi:hypothetical protein
MIGAPVNDEDCLGAITERIRTRVADRDPELVVLAERYPTPGALIDWMRSLPQRDDDGDPEDGPKVAACDPIQRLRVPTDDPNCVERAALYIAVAELIDPTPVRALKTKHTEAGWHTLPVEDGAEVVLDPRLDAERSPSTALPPSSPTPLPSAPPPAVVLPTAPTAPVPVEIRDVIEWTAQMAEAGAPATRNGPSRVRTARNAIRRLVEAGEAPASAREVDAIGWLLALAEQTAQHYGPQAIEMVRTTARAIADLSDELLILRAQRTEPHRNLSLDIGGLHLEPPPWLSGLGRVAGRVGLDVGAAALAAKLASMGITPDIVDLVEAELNRDGLTLGPLAHPPTLAAAQARASRP